MASAQWHSGTLYRQFWRGLVYLCCALTFALGTPDPACWAFVGPVTVVEAPEGEERPANDEPDDSKDGEQGKSEEASLARQPRSRKLPRRGATAAGWVAHLPHHHGGTPGYRLPICSPFERGALLPLRC